MIIDLYCIDIQGLLVLKLCSEELTVQTCDVRYCDVLRTLHLTSLGVCTSTEAEFVHLGDHCLSTLCTLYLTLWEKSE